MTYWRLYYHLIWSTKGRMPVIEERIERILVRAIPGFAKQSSSLIHAIGVMPDHVHVAISIPPKNAVSMVVNQIKGGTSHLLNHEEKLQAPDWQGWQAEYGVVTFSERSLDAVKEYVLKQREHHASNRLMTAYEREVRDGEQT